MVKQEAKDVVQQLQAQGARVKVYSCDVGIEEQVEAMIQDSKANMPPIRGVIQGAMVLRVIFLLPPHLRKDLLTS